MKNELVSIKCKECVHAGICKYTNDYMTIRDAIMNLEIIKNYPFVSDISINCIFYTSLAGVTLTCSPTISKDSTGYTEIKNVAT